MSLKSQLRPLQIQPAVLGDFGGAPIGKSAEIPAVIVPQLVDDLNQLLTGRAHGLHAIIVTLGPGHRGPILDNHGRMNLEFFGQEAHLGQRLG